MTREELKAARHKLGLSCAEFAEVVGVEAARTVQRWEDGSRDVPGPVVILVDLLLTMPKVRKRLLPPAK